MKLKKIVKTCDTCDNEKQCDILANCFDGCNWKPKEIKKKLIKW